MSTAYDFATLNRMLGMSSATRLSIIGRIDFSITSKLMAGASVYVVVSTDSLYMSRCELTEMAKQVVIRYR